MKKSEYLYTTQDAEFDHHELSMTIIAPLVSFVMLKMHGDFQTITAANIELHSYHFAVPCLGNPLSVILKPQGVTEGSGGEGRISTKAASAAARNHVLPLPQGASSACGVLRQDRLNDYALSRLIGISQRLYSIPHPVP